ncbi:hypothetical protein ACFXCZ_02845 [Streptomyces sp. NPDC059396]|uniref:hypothetical protein n=1 Tax=Streptomyces sp. NPDC059396 TaxID=3346819 RepID=UPI00368FE4BA
MSDLDTPETTGTAGPPDTPGAVAGPGPSGTAETDGRADAPGAPAPSGTPRTRDTSAAPVTAVPRAAPPLRAELLRGVGPWGGIASALVIGVTMYSQPAGWEGRWGDVTDLLRAVALLISGPLAVAVGCWQGGRERRRGTEELWGSVPRTRLRQVLLAVAPAACWPVVGYLVAAAGCLLVAWPYTSGSRPFVSLIGADAVVLGALGVLGFVAGRLIPWRLAAPMLAAVTYVGLAIPLYSDSPARWLDPAVQHSYTWDQPVWWFGPASAVWTGGLALAALLAYAARHRALALLPLALAVAAAVPIARTGDAVWYPDPQAARLVCDDGSPQVCVTAVDRKLLPGISAALAGLNAKLRGVPGAPARWIDGPYGSDTRPGDVRLPTPAEPAVRGRLADPASYANDATWQLLDDDCNRTASDAVSYAQVTDIDHAVGQWLAPRPDFSPSRSPEVTARLKRLQAMDAEQGRAYLTRYLAADHCRPDTIPVP